MFLAAFEFPLQVSRWHFPNCERYVAASREKVAVTASAVPALVYSDVPKLCPLVSSAGSSCRLALWWELPGWWEKLISDWAIKILKVRRFPNEGTLKKSIKKKSMEIPGSYEILSDDRCNISLWPSKLFAECLCSLELRLSQRRIFSFPLSESTALLMYLLRLIHSDILHYTIKLELSDSGLYSLGFFLAADLRYHNSLSSGVKDTSAISLIPPH